jgi:hypothetical protein
MSSMFEPWRCAIQRRATRPCAAWNNRIVGRPAGGGISDIRVKYPAIEATKVVTASGSAARATGWCSNTSSGVGPPSSRAPAADRPSRPWCTDRCPWPIDDHIVLRPGSREEHIVAAKVEMNEAIAVDGVGNVDLEFSEPLEMSMTRR